MKKAPSPSLDKDPLSYLRVRLPLKLDDLKANLSELVKFKNTLPAELKNDAKVQETIAELFGGAGEVG